MDEHDGRVGAFTLLRTCFGKHMDAALDNRPVLLSQNKKTAAALDELHALSRRIGAEVAACTSPGVGQSLRRLLTSRTTASTLQDMFDRVITCARFVETCANVAAASGFGSTITSSWMDLFACDMYVKTITGVVSTAMVAYSAVVYPTLSMPKTTDSSQNLQNTKTQKRNVDVTPADVCTWQLFTCLHRMEDVVADHMDPAATRAYATEVSSDVTAGAWNIAIVKDRPVFSVVALQRADLLMSQGRQTFRSSFCCGSGHGCMSLILNVCTSDMCDRDLIEEKIIDGRSVYTSTPGAIVKGAPSSSIRRVLVRIVDLATLYGLWKELDATWEAVSAPGMPAATIYAAYGLADTLQAFVLWNTAGAEHAPGLADVLEGAQGSFWHTSDVRKRLRLLKSSNTQRACDALLKLATARECPVCLEPMAETDVTFLDCCVKGMHGPVHVVCAGCWSRLASRRSCPLCMRRASGRSATEYHKLLAARDLA